MAQAETAFSTTNGAAIAAKNTRARLSIGREVELLRIRREADEAAFRLIALLNLDEPDPDLEDNGDDEPTIGWTIGEAAYGRTKNPVSHDDGEFEPSLGWTPTLNQTSRNRLGETNDREADDADREPSLGAPETVPGPGTPVGWWSEIDLRYSQEAWAKGDGRDLEAQCEDEGAQCEDEGADATASPAYYARLRARREAGKAVAS